MATQTPAQDVSDAVWTEFARIKLWFFRDLVDAQRKALFLLCGFSDAVTHGELDTHSAQLRALRHALRIDAAESQLAELRGKCERLVDRWANDSNYSFYECEHDLRTLAAADGATTGEMK